MKQISPLWKDFTGEFIGTFNLVLFGTGVVALSVCFGEFASTWEIGMVWGFVVIVSIYATRSLCGAHFNPSVTLAMAVTKRMPWGRVPVYLVAQFLGAFAGSLMVYALFHGAISNYEITNGIVRGTQESMATAKMFGEYYCLPGHTWVSMPVAMAAEAIGAFILIFMIFCMTDSSNLGRPDSNFWPVLVGFTLSICIGLLGPVTQGGFNAARDFAPRLVALIFGWGDAVYQSSCNSWN